MMKRSSRPEVLAPAGDAASLAAALAAGADAVYFGLDAGFNARARASNFPPERLRETVVQCHRAGVKVYLTLNTLVFERELEEAARLVALAAASGVDALIVQDPAVALIARELAPTLEIHASTQMTVSSPEGARFAQDLGATRVVVPRELSVDDIRRFAAESDVELEVFIHGALCVSWSGQCLTSEAWSGRSANRGQCAQSCRMPYDLVLDGALRQLDDLAYLLSPKDLAGVRALPALVELGVHGLKIEGRQKGAPYVATATAGYRRWVDALLEPKGRDAALAALPGEIRDLALTYSRGFSDGFLAGNDHQTLVEGRFPKHRGVYVGRVAAVADDFVLVEKDPAGRPWTGGAVLDGPRVGPRGAVSSPLPGCGGADDAASGPSVAPVEIEPGMGIVFDGGDPEDKNEPGGPVFRVGREGRELRLEFGRPGPDLSRVRIGHRVWVTSDPRLARSARRLVEAPEVSGRNPVALRVRGRAEAPLVVEAVTERGERVQAPSRVPLAPARGRGIDRAILEEKLTAFGGTPFAAASLDLTELESGLHLPVSELKALRRALVEELEAILAARHHVNAPVAGVVERLVEERRTRARPRDAVSAAPVVVPLCRNDEQLEAVIEAGLPGVELDWMELMGLGRAVERAREAGLEVTLASLRVQKPGEDGFGSALERHAPDAVLVRHWGALVRFKEGAGARPRLHGDFSLNVTNALTAWHLFDYGLDTITASHDLDERQLGDLLDAVPPERVTVVVQHRVPAFHTEHCVYAHLLSEGRDFRTCGRPCDSHEIALRDHLGRDHPVIVDAGCRNTVFNSEVQTAARLVPDLLARGVRRYRVEFVREDRDQAARALAAWGDLLARRTTPAALGAALATVEKLGVVSK